jgi:hypothetical protein
MPTSTDRGRDRLSSLHAVVEVDRGRHVRKRLSALGETRTPNLLIRRPSCTVEAVRGVVSHKALTSTFYDVVCFRRWAHAMVR